MQEKDIRAVTEMLFEIKNNPMLLPGFERLLYKYGYWGIKDLGRTFQKLCDSMDEWGNPVEYLHIMEDTGVGMLSEGVPPESQWVHGMEVKIDMAPGREHGS